VLVGADVASTYCYLLSLELYSPRNPLDSPFP
jgi:hypothetical protein